MDEPSAIEARIQELEQQLQLAREKNENLSSRQPFSSEVSRPVQPEIRGSSHLRTPTKSDPSPASSPGQQMDSSYSKAPHPPQSPPRNPEASYMHPRPPYQSPPSIPEGYIDPRSYMGYPPPMYNMPSYPMYFDRQLEALQKHFQQQLNLIREQSSPTKALQSLQTRNSRLQDTIKETQDRLKVAENSNAQLKAQIESMRKSEDSNEVKAQKRLNEQLERKLDDSRNEYVRIEKDLGKANNKIHELVTDLDDYRNKYERAINDFKNEKTHMAKEINYLKEQIENKAAKEKTDNERLRKELDEAYRTVEELQMNERQPRKSFPEEKKLQRNPRVRKSEESFRYFSPPERAEGKRHYHSPPERVEGKGYFHSPPERGRARPERQPVEDNSKQDLEHYLMNLQFEKTKLESEFIRLPAQNRSISVKRKRESLQEDLEVIESNINRVKAKLKSLKT